jgi:hypothetical protein
MTTPMQNITKVTIEFGSGETLVMEPGMEVDFILGVATNVQKTKEGYVADIPAPAFSVACPRELFTGTKTSAQNRERRWSY